MTNCVRFTSYAGVARGLLGFFSELGDNDDAWAEDEEGEKEVDCDDCGGNSVDEVEEFTSDVDDERSDGSVDNEHVVEVVVEEKEDDVDTADDDDDDEEEDDNNDDDSELSASAGAEEATMLVAMLSPAEDEVIKRLVCFSSLSFFRSSSPA
tara:strand:+ start:81 stop:536 length:456 start_codon:yes stop_codon:yes gene_type:complete